MRRIPRGRAVAFAVAWLGASSCASPAGSGAGARDVALSSGEDSAGAALPDAASGEITAPDAGSAPDASDALLAADTFQTAADSLDSSAPDAVDAATPCVATPESCNGLDDDCDGLTDEGEALCGGATPCSTAPVCSAGQCQQGSGIDCDDGNPCTDDSCATASGCVHVANSAACDDGNACSVGDGCQDKVCVGSGVKDCDDGNPCTSDTCSGAGVCGHVATDGLPCGTVGPCTSQGVCLGSTCQPGMAKGCDDGNPCTDDSCDPAQGCVNLPGGVTCEDGNPCTQGDHCDGGTCAAGANTCECQSDADCETKPGGNPCQGKLICDLGGPVPACVVQPGTAVVCASSTGPCSLQTCDPGTGSCVPLAVNQGLGCEDGNACTQGDVCFGGACQPGAPSSCDDGNPCTLDGCDPKQGCLHTATTGPCEDGNACTLADLCKAGACVPGSAKACEDGNACTVDSCLPSTGSCANEADPANGKACLSSQGACVSSATCQAGACVAGPALDCDDGNACTTDACDTKAACLHTPAPASCSDGNPCTNDSCVLGQCVGSPKSCDDGNPCTTDGCSASSGECLHQTIAGCVSHGQRLWGGVYADQFWSVRALPDGGWLASGDTTSWGAGGGDGLAVRTDACGSPVWARTYGGPGKEVFYASSSTPDGGFLLAGTSYSGDASGNFVVVRIDGSGAPLWTWSGGGPSYDFAKAVASTSDGGCIVVGKTYSFGPNSPGEHNGLVVKLDSTGKQQWSQVFASPEGAGSMDTSGVGEVKDKAGKWNGFLVVGGSEGYGQGSDDVWLMRLAPDGTHLWSVAHGGTGDDDPQTGFVQTADGCFVLGLWETGFGAQKADAGLLKTDADGKVVWMKRYGGYAKEEPYALVQVGQDFVMTGYSNSWTDGGIDAFLMRAGPTGDLLWWRTYGGPQDESSQGVAPTSDGGFVLAGRGNSAGKGGFDAWMAKTGPDGLVGCQDATVSSVQVASITPVTTWFTPIFLSAGSPAALVLTSAPIDVGPAGTTPCPCQ